MKIAQRIKKRRTELGLSQNELASRCGWNQSRIAGYETGIRIPPVKAINKIEKVLGLFPGYLTLDSECLTKNQQFPTSNGIALLQERYKITVETPVLVMNEAHLWRERMNEMRADMSRKRLPIFEKDNLDTFGLEVENDVMSPEFKTGDLLLIDPDKQPRSNSYVVVRLLKSEPKANILRQYVVDGAHVHLIALNPVYEKITVNPTDIEICGVVTYKNYAY